MSRFSLGAWLAPLALLPLLAAPPAAASYVADCDVEAKIVKVLGVTANGVKAEFKVNRLLRGSGHNRNHCQAYPKRPSFTHVIQTGVPAAIKVGAVLQLRFEVHSGMTPTGPRSNERWTLAPATKAALSTHPLDVASACTAKPSGANCGLDKTPLVFGHNASGQLLLWNSRSVGGCGDDTIATASTKIVMARAHKGGLKTSGSVDIAVAHPDDPPAKRTKALGVLSGLAKKGYVPVYDLIASKVEKPAGIQAHEPMAKLGGALTGWELHLTYAKGRYAATLTKGTKTHKLGSVKAPLSQQYDEETGKPKKKAPAPYPSVEQVSLVRYKTVATLVVAISGHDGGHCSDGKVDYLTAPLPKL